MTHPDPRLAWALFQVVTAVLALMVNSSNGRQLAPGDITQLIEAYRDSTSERRHNIRRDIIQLGRPAIAPLESLLHDDEADIRELSVACLAELIHRGDRDIIATFTLLLRDPSENVRRQAVRALGHPNILDDSIVEVLADTLRNDTEVFVRSAVAGALGKIPDFSRPAIHALAEAVLHDDEPFVRNIAITSLRLFYERWIVALADSNRRIVRISSLDEPVWGPEFRRIVTPVYVAALMKNDAKVKLLAVEGLRNFPELTPDLVPQLLSAMNDEDADVRVAIVQCLSVFSPSVDDALAGLVKSLGDKEESVWRESARSIGRKGLDAMPYLVPYIQANEQSVHASGAALAAIAQRLQDTMATLSDAELKDSLDSIESAAAILGPPESHPELRRALQALQLELLSRRTGPLVDRLTAVLNAVVSSRWIWAATAYLLYTCVCFAFWLVCPDVVRRYNDILESLASTFPQINKRVHLSRFLIVGMLVHSNRVLDAWVNRCLPVARERFRKLPTVREREIHVDLPVKINDSLVTEVSASKVREHFVRNMRIAIVGPGGSGKTSLACQLGKWAMHDVKNERLTDHPMLTVLIEEEFDVAKIVETVHGKLQHMSDSMQGVTREFCISLLKSKRVLVIVDRFSEFSDAVRERIRAERPEFPIAALIVTSRNPEPTLGGVTCLEPVMLCNNQVSDFVRGYLGKAGHREFLETDRDFFAFCEKLTQVIGDRKVTPLLAKMYIDQAVRRKTERAFNGLPNNIPEMILRYLDELDGSGDSQTKRQKQCDAMIVAWLCVQERFVPDTACRDKAISELGGDDAEVRLRVLEQRLQIVATTGSRHDRVRFVLDPVAEYLAAMRIAERYKGNRHHWKRLLDRISKESESTNVKGFCLALNDVRMAPGYDVPEFVKEELSKLATGCETYIDGTRESSVEH